MKKINLAMAWGGTGGHVFPIKSLIQHIYKYPKYADKINKIVRFWENNSLEQEVFLQLKANTDVEDSGKSSKNLFFENIISGKYRRETRLKSKLKNIRDAFRFVFWIFQSLYLIQKHSIDVIFCKWWYVALPVVLAWKLLGKKILVHESDVKSWLVNKIAARYASTVFTGFKWVLQKSKTIWQILSDDIISTQSTKNIPNPSTNQHTQWYNLSVAEQLYYTDPDKTQIIVMWGSQWSQRLYQNLLDSVDLNKAIYKNYEIFIVLWKENQENQIIKNGFDKYQNIHVFDFVTQQEMGLLLKNCDIALTRAWTTSLAEQKLYNLKIVMVPIPRTHDQYDNAKFYVKTHKDILLDSRSETYNQDMLDIFTKHISFKKQTTKQSQDILAKISIAKNIILDAIIK